MTDEDPCARCGHERDRHGVEGWPPCDWMNVSPGCICGSCWEVSCACEGYVEPGSPVPDTCCHVLHLIDLDGNYECLKCGERVSPK